MNFYSSSIITALITTTHERIPLLSPGPCAGEARAPGTSGVPSCAPPCWYRRQINQAVPAVPPNKTAQSVRTEKKTTPVSGRWGHTTTV